MVDRNQFNQKVRSVRRFLESIRKSDPSAEVDQQSESPDVKLVENSVNQHEVEKNMSLEISGLAEIGGFVGGCVVDSDTGLMLASEGGGNLDLEAAGAANTQVVKAKLQAIETLALDDAIEDILITLGKQFHLIRPLEKNPTVFIYVALDKKAANLGLARIQVKKVEQTLSI